MNEITEGHIMHRYDEEMKHLNKLVQEMTGLVRDQLRNAVHTLKTGDTEAARRVISRDEEVNDLDIQADDELIHVIAKRQPMGKDLREILTVGKIVSDLERVGDEARKIAYLTVNFYGNDTPAPNNRIIMEIVKMAEFVDRMLYKSIEAFENLDLALAVEILRMNEEIESEFDSALRHLSTYMMEDSRSIGHVIETVLGLRALERMGGHAKNVAGYVVFLIKGKDVRHASLEAVAAELEAD